MRLSEARDPLAGAVEKRGVVEGMGGEQMLQIRGRAAVEMHAARVEEEAERRLAARAGRKERAQEGVLDPQKGRPRARRDPFAAPGGRALPPDADHVARPRQAERDPVAGEGEDPAQAALREEPAVEYAETPGARAPCVALPRRGCRHSLPLIAEAAESTCETVPSVPVKAEITRLHCVKGASVT